MEKEQEEDNECTFKPQIIEYNRNEMECQQASPSEDVKNSIEDAIKSSKPDSGSGSKISPTKVPHVMVSTTSSTRDRCAMLYDLSKKKVKKQDKPTDAYIYEKNTKEFTFAPNLKKDKADPNKPFASGVEETINRLKAARDEAERKKRSLEIKGGDDPGVRFTMNKSKFTGNFKQFEKKGKGQPEQKNKISPKTEEKIESSKDGQKPPFSTEISPQQDSRVDEDQNERAANMPKQVSEADKREAMLFIEVNLSGAKKRIVVYKGDTAVALAEKFADENSK